MESKSTGAQVGADLSILPPARWRKLVLRLATLVPGMAYTLTVFVLPGDKDPIITVTPLGRIEGGSKSCE